MKNSPTGKHAAADDQLQSEIEKIVSDALETKTSELRAETRLDEIESLDSFGIITLFMSLEERFGLQFTTDEIIGLKTIGEIVSEVAKRRER